MKKIIFIYLFIFINNIFAQNNQDIDSIKFTYKKINILNTNKVTYNFNAFLKANIWLCTPVYNNSPDTLWIAKIQSSKGGVVPDLRQLPYMDNDTIHTYSRFIAPWSGGVISWHYKWSPDIIYSEPMVSTIYCYILFETIKNNNKIQYTIIQYFTGLFYIK